MYRVVHRKRNSWSGMADEGKWENEWKHCSGMLMHTKTTNRATKQRYQVSLCVLWKWICAKTENSFWTNATDFYSWALFHKRNCMPACKDWYTQPHRVCAAPLVCSVSLVHSKLIFCEHTTYHGWCERGENIIFSIEIWCAVRKHEIKCENMSKLRIIFPVYLCKD